ncbi:MAG: AfsR/SARP family transcriptional regulator [Mycobacteriales bacterium]
MGRTTAGIPDAGIPDAVEFCVLGPVEMRVAGRSAVIGPPQQRLVLAALALDAGRPVGTATLIDRVWDEAPNGARRAVHVHITRLRRLLTGEVAAEPLVRRSGGYVLDVDPDQVDALRFERLLERARRPERTDGDRLGLLRQAVALWRGEPLAGLPGAWAGRTREAWRQRYLTAMVTWAQAEVRSGDPAAPVGPLTNLAGEFPLVEPLAAGLIQALHAAGQTAAALAAYSDFRRRLVEELGAEPGPRLQELQQAVLRGDLEVGATQPASQPATQPAAPAEPAPRPVPAQLPGDVPAFTGRQDELATLDRLLVKDGRDRSTAVVISAVSGTAGVGKTALAVHWAHQVADRFPDGQLYVNLRGYDPDQPMAPADALARFLEPLGVAGKSVPADLDERAARYRTEIAGRRMLVVLDNAATVEQVRPLLPGTPSAVVLVTSRDSLAGLVAMHGAHRLDLDLLDPAEALALLRRLVGQRVDLEPEAAATLADQCARLPLALRVAAELAVSRPATALADLADELRDQRRRLELLDAGGDPRAAVPAVFSWSLQHLSPDAARAFRLLGPHPGPDADAYATAALAGTGLERARRVLDTLARAHLAHPTTPGRYGMHDLLRAYATSLCDDGETAAALGRLFDYHLYAAAAAMDALYPAESHRRPRVPAPGSPTPDLADPDTARSWLEAELPCLVTACAHMAAHGWPAHAVRLSAILYRHLDGGYYTEALAIHAQARQAAGRLGDRAAEGLALLGLGTAHERLGRHGPATEHLQQALELYRQAGDQVGQARALTNLGNVEQRIGRYGDSADHHQQALARYQQAGDRTGEAHAYNNLGLVEQRLGRYAAAVEHHRQALALFRRSGDRTGEAYALDNLGNAEERQGRYAVAAGHHQQALDLCRQLGNRAGEAWARYNLGVVHTSLGRPDQAVEYHRRTLEDFREIGDRYGEAWALNGLGEAARAVARPAEAVTRHLAALAAAVETGARDQVARAHAGLGHAHHALNRPARARQHYTLALDLYTELGMPEADGVRTALSALDQPRSNSAR